MATAFAQLRVTDVDRLCDDAVAVTFDVPPELTQEFTFRPGQSLTPLAAQVRSTVAATVERLMGLQLGAVTVLVDGVGG